ncbi:MAG: type II toxin-antitoxin system RelE/ParE family toxin [Novosphingobium sp.]|nr:MAG: type II toxin-antitoxin system RelE/ParE family toxin [Novosphingobium sp.]
MIRYTEAARADVRALRRHGVEAYGVARSDAYADGLQLSILRLEPFPEPSPHMPGVAPGIRVMPYRMHIVLYVVDEQGVRILRIRHGAEDWLDFPDGGFA